MAHNVEALPAFSRIEPVGDTRKLVLHSIIHVFYIEIQKIDVPKNLLQIPAT